MERNYEKRVLDKVLSMAAENKKKRMERMLDFKKDTALLGNLDNTKYDMKNILSEKVMSKSLCLPPRKDANKP